MAASPGLAQGHIVTLCTATITRGVQQLSVAVCILAKDEARTIGRALEQIARQSLLRSATSVEVHVVANGTTDATVALAQAARSIIEDAGARLFVHDLEQGGKSRAWNKAVHSLVGETTQTALFMDADIELHSDEVFEELCRTLSSDRKVKVCSGYPVKDINRKSSKSPLDAFSLAVSHKSRKPGAINGSLYAARVAVLRDIWLPDETPGEDGFLNAMVTTNGFTQPVDAESVRTLEAPTHSYKAHDARGFFSHERRMIVGTVVNIWMFEHLWSLKSRKPVGDLIRRWNEDDPQWVDKIIRKRIGKRNWLVPKEIILGRLKAGSLRQLAYLPVALAATVLTIPPALMANQRLKKIGAAATW